MFGRPGRRASRLQPPRIGRLCWSAACRTGPTGADFVAQVHETDVPVEEKLRFCMQAGNFVVLGYALVGHDGDLLAIEDSGGFNGRVSAALVPYLGLTSRRMAFRHVRAPERAPQIRMEKLRGEDATYLEGMRLPKMPTLSTSIY